MIRLVSASIFFADLRNSTGLVSVSSSGSQIDLASMLHWPLRLTRPQYSSAAFSSISKVALALSSPSSSISAFLASSPYFS